MAITQSDGWRDSGGSGGGGKQGVVRRKEGEMGKSTASKDSRLGQDVRESVRERRYGSRSGGLWRLRC